MPIYVRFRGLQNLMYSDNLRKIRKELDISAQKMADKLGVSQGSIAQYESGKREPNYNFISRLNEVYNVNLNWFVSGQGEMFNGTQKQPPEDIKQLVSDLVDAKFREKGLY